MKFIKETAKKHDLARGDGADPDYRQGFRDGARWMRARSVELGDSLAEKIKHTSHRDGLGMGDQRSEGAVHDYQDRIRGIK